MKDAVLEIAFLEDVAQFPPSLLSVPVLVGRFDQMKILFSLCLVGLFFTGCVSTRNLPISEQQIQYLEGRTLTVSTRVPPQFSILTNAQGLTFGLTNALGVPILPSLSVDPTEALIEGNVVVDPSRMVAKSLAEKLGEQYSVVLAENDRAAINTSKDAEISAAYAGSADILIDVQTTYWSCIYVPLKWGKYRIGYMAKMRMIDLHDGKTISEGFFTWETPDEYPLPTYDEVFQDDAKELRKQLEMATHDAVGFFEKEILRME